MQHRKFLVGHEFLRTHLFYPVALSTALCMALIVARVVISGSSNYEFLDWNLFLAWLPYLFALWILTIRRRESGRPWKLVLPGALWMLFLPNAPYIVTDFNHLLHRRAFPLMYDIVLIFAFAWTGLLLGVASLHLLEGSVRRAWGKVAAAGFVVASAALAGAGIYLGRFLRWNSWDVLKRPGDMIATLVDVVHNPMEHTYAIGHSLVFTTMLLICHVTFVAFRQANRPS
jgi:uncharacterized membrane protein